MRKSLFVLTIVLLGLTAPAQEMRSYSITGTNTSAAYYWETYGDETNWVVLLKSADDNTTLGSTRVDSVVENQVHILPWTTPAITEGRDVFYRILNYMPGGGELLNSSVVTLPSGPSSTNVLNSSFDFSESTWEVIPGVYPFVHVNISVVSNSVDVEWETETYAKYQLMSADLTSGAWTNVGEWVSGEDGVTNHVIISTLDNPSACFRIQKELDL